ncbi:MAG: hypothetical protein AABP62_18905 [Planctomycetota bacterium]
MKRGVHLVNQQVHQVILGNCTTTGWMAGVESSSLQHRAGYLALLGTGEGAHPSNSAVCALLRKIAAVGLMKSITRVLDNAAYQRCQLVRA